MNRKRAVRRCWKKLQQHIPRSALRIARLARLRLAPQRHYLDLVPEVQATVDIAAWQAAEEAWRRTHSQDFHLHYAKYFDLPHWLPGSLTVARDTGLLERPGKRVLDIGCGPAILGHVARHFGHGYLGLDLGNPMFELMAKALGVEVQTHRVVPGQPLPAALQGFDVICSINAKFYLGEKIDGRVQRLDWSGADWRFFLADCRRRLRPDGVVYLKLNRPEAIDTAGRRLLEQGAWPHPRTVMLRRDQLPEPATALA
jgi:SAM-dependent methyltransferase